MIQTTSQSLSKISPYKLNVGLRNIVILLSSLLSNSSDGLNLIGASIVCTQQHQFSHYSKNHTHKKKWKLPQAIAQSQIWNLIGQNKETYKKVIESGPERA